MIINFDVLQWWILYTGIVTQGLDRTLMLHTVSAFPSFNNILRITGIFYRGVVTSQDPLL